MVFFWASGGILGPSWRLQAVFATLGRLLVCLLGRSWVPCGGPGPLPWASGAPLGRSWTSLGPLLGYPGCPLNLSWVSFGGSRAAAGSQKRLFTTPCININFSRVSMVFPGWGKPPGSFLGPSWPPLGPSWRLLGRVALELPLGHSWLYLAVCGSSEPPLGAAWASPGAVLGRN